jgi:hypothetical protein
MIFFLERPLMKEKYKNVLMEVQLAVIPKTSSPQHYSVNFEFIDLIQENILVNASLTKYKSDLKLFKIILRHFSKI